MNNTISSNCQGYCEASISYSETLADSQVGFTKWTTLRQIEVHEYAVTEAFESYMEKSIYECMPIAFCLLLIGQKMSLYSNQQIQGCKGANKCSFLAQV